MELTNFEKTGTNEVKLTVTVVADEFKLAVDNAIRVKGKKLAVPGFRKGKAPKALLEKHYGRAYFYQDAINDTYGAAILDTATSVNVKFGYTLEFISADGQYYNKNKYNYLWQEPFL